MLLKSRRTICLLVIGLLLSTSAAQAGIFKGHPYSDPHAGFPSSCGVSGYMSASTSWGTPAYGTAGQAYAAVQSDSATATPAYNNCPPVTNALLCVWVSEDATVWVNGHETKPQTLAGKHEGSRIFSLARLAPDEMQEAVVQVAMKDGRTRTETLLVQAGKTYEVSIPRELPFDADDPISSAIRSAVQRAVDAADDALTASKAAESAVAQVELAVENAKAQVDAVADAKAAIDKLCSDLTTLAAAADQSAKQAARSNTESFEFVHDHKSIVGWAKYKSNGSLAKLLFDGPSTRTHLEFEETSGALDDMKGVEIVLKYHFTIQVPDAAGTSFQDEKTFDIDAKATFIEGHARVPFFDRDHPDLHLSAKFKEVLVKHWSQRFDPNGRVKVKIIALRPNGKEAPVKPAKPATTPAAATATTPDDDRITIEIKHQTN